MVQFLRFLIVRCLLSISPLRLPGFPTPITYLPLSCRHGQFSSRPSCSTSTHSSVAEIAENNFRTCSQLLFSNLFLFGLIRECKMGDGCFNSKCRVSRMNYQRPYGLKQRLCAYYWRLWMWCLLIDSSRRHKVGYSCCARVEFEQISRTETPIKVFKASRLARSLFLNTTKHVQQQCRLSFLFSSVVRISGTRRQSLQMLHVLKAAWGRIFQTGKDG